MIQDQIERLFETNGYNKVPSNLPEFTFYYREENQGATVIHVIDYRQGIYISEDQYSHLKTKITEFMQAKGEQETHLLSLILSDDTEKAKKLCVGDSFCWMIDTAGRRLIIHENQVGDFYGWKGILEEFLLNLDVITAGRNTYEDSGDSTCTAEEGRRGFRRSRPGGNHKKIQAGRLPWVNICLVAVNVIVFIICTITGDVLYNKGASGVMLIIEDKSYYRMITSMFLHSDTGHLFSNMIIVYFMGQIVERRLGHIPYAALYFLSGIAGDVLSMGYELLSGNYSASVGASGAVFGVEGALLLLVILYRSNLEYMTPGKVVFSIAFALYCGFTSTGINNAAHIGGLLMGFALAAVFCMFLPHAGSGKDGGVNES